MCLWMILVSFICQGLYLQTIQITLEISKPLENDFASYLLFLAIYMKEKKMSYSSRRKMYHHDKISESMRTDSFPCNL